MRKVVAEDVARVAGVSLAAVSRAFRPGRPISEETRRRVQEAARQLGYVSPSAQVMESLGTGTITVVAGDLANPFYPMAINSLMQQIHARGCRMMLQAVGRDETVDNVMRQVLDFRSDAAIVASALMSSKLARACREQNLPVVLFNRIQPDAGMTAVSCDNYGGGRLVAQRFLALGRSRIAMIGGRTDTSTHLERARGFTDALAEAGLAPLAAPSGHYDYAASLATARGLLQSDLRIDALFCINDIMGLAAMDAARELGVSVPDDLAVVGFDDIPMASWPSYRMTTVRQPLEMMVSETLDLVERLRAAPERRGMIRILPVELIARDSG